MYPFVNRKVRISNEERIISNLLWGSNKLKDSDFQNINYEKFVKICSSHLIIPLIYLKLKKYNYLNQFPDDLVNYFCQIHEINYNRNKELKKEAKNLANIFKVNKINYVFIKGVAYLFKNLYQDLGERMIGDIDVLIEKKDMEKVKTVLTKINYKPVYNFDFPGLRHIARRINKNKLFCVEIHHSLFDKTQKELNEDNVFKDKAILKGMFLPSNKNQLKYNILSYQKNDSAEIMVNFSFRNFYDTFLLKKAQEYSFNLKEWKFNSFKNYFLIAEIFGLNLNQTENKLINSIKLLRFSYKRNSRIYYIFDEYISSLIVATKRINKIHRNFCLFLVNKFYRNFIYNKIKKTLKFND